MLTLLRRLMNSCGLGLAVTVLAFFTATAGAVTIRHVDGDIDPAGGNGQFWETAYKYLQDALAEAALNANANNPYQIWVATTDPANPYRTDRDAAHPDGRDPIDRTMTFALAKNVLVYGGFAGGETDLPQRDPINNVTVLSGAIGTDPEPPCGPGAGDCYTAHPEPGCEDGSCCTLVCDQPGLALCCISGWIQGCADAALELCPVAAYHAVSAVDITLVDPGDRPPRLDGFTITGGIANGTSGDQGRGGGMIIRDASPYIVQCTFLDNLAAKGGTLSVDLFGDVPLIVNCTFLDNTAQTIGGAVWTAGAPQLVNCVFTGNEAETDGGAVYNEGAASLVNCTLSQNTAMREGGAVFTYDGPDDPPNPPDTWHTTLVNSIVWTNSEPQLAGTVGAGYSDVEGGLPPGGIDGGGNIELPPLFADADSGDFRLELGSPCIDAGRDADVPGDAADLDGDGDLLEQTPHDLVPRPRFAHHEDTPDPHPCATGPVNMGAFESGDCDGDLLPDDQEPDTNGDGVPDDCQNCDENEYLDPIDLQDCPQPDNGCDECNCKDCNQNTVPDKCDIQGGCSTDKDGNWVPDECECHPDKLDIVFIVDTSPSMTEDGETAQACTMATNVVNQLRAYPACLDDPDAIEAAFLRITVNPPLNCTGFPGTVDSVVGLLGNQDPTLCDETIDSSESWGPATALVAQSYPWRQFVRRVIVPISDEGSCDGNETPEGCSTIPGSGDRESIETAITLSDLGRVFVYPVTGMFNHSIIRTRRARDPSPGSWPSGPRAGRSTTSATGVTAVSATSSRTPCWISLSVVSIPVRPTSTATAR
jgi:predicted outer membrane repeat protein